MHNAIWAVKILRIPLYRPGVTAISTVLLQGEVIQNIQVISLLYKQHV